jgi:single-strand DNA-binding protein
MSLNKVLLIGNLGHDPSSRYTAAGLQVVTFSLATTERHKDKETKELIKSTEWHKIITYDNLASACVNFLHKGSKVYVEGKIQTRKYQDKNGVDKIITEIIANNVQFLDSKEESTMGEPEQTNVTSSNNVTVDDDLPF